jgi:hypothetical protein
LTKYFYQVLTKYFLSYIFAVSMEETQTQQPQETMTTDAPPGAEDEKKAKNKKVIAIVLIIAAIVLIGGGAYFLLSSPPEESQPSPTPRPVATPAQTPMATEIPDDINREDVKIDVQNGTGIEGEATFLKDELNALGYTNVEVGNASKQDNTATIITYSKDVDEAVKLEITALCEQEYSSVKEVSGSPGAFDVEIITGLRRGMTPKPEATEAPEATSTPKPSPTATPDEE